MELPCLSWLSNSIFSISVPFATVLFSANPQHIVAHYSDLYYTLYTLRSPRVPNSQSRSTGLYLRWTSSAFHPNFRVPLYFGKLRELDWNISFRLETSSCGLRARQTRTALAVDDQRFLLSILSVATALHSSQSLTVPRPYPGPETYTISGSRFFV
jgi:hypothetical protein